MRLGTIATLLCAGAIALAGCGTESDDDRASASGRNDRPPGTESVLAEAPDVAGEPAEDGSSALKAAGFEPAFDPEPDDPSPCTITDQDRSGEIAEGSEVILTLECMVDVPDLSDEPANEAVSQLEDLGLTASYEEEPDDSTACTVEDQDVVGEVEPESEVVLSVLCKLPDVTGEDLRTAVSRLEVIGYSADHQVVDDPSLCTVTSHRSQAEPGAAVDLGVHCAHGD